jgi:hypothetical protein
VLPKLLILCANTANAVLPTLLPRLTTHSAAQQNPSCQHSDANAVLPKPANPVLPRCCRLTTHQQHSNTRPANIAIALFQTLPIMCCQHCYPA